MKLFRNGNKHLICALLVAASLAGILPAAASAQVLFLRGTVGNTVAQEQLELATRFYGLKLQTLNVQSPTDVSSALDQVEQQDTLAVVAEAPELDRIQASQLLSALHRPGSGNVPLLIVGITPDVASPVLRQWSGDAVSACTAMPPARMNAAYVVSADEASRQLAGAKLPAVLSAACAFTLDNSHAMTLLSVDGLPASTSVFARAETNSEQVFFLADMKPSPNGANPPKTGLGEVFSRVAPFLMFVRFAAGDNGWHSPGHYANLTVDDAWLTEPYGYLDYETLYPEMQKHNFHLTVAFIPWNYDRSEPGLVSFLQSHSDRFSFVVHGNNHDHLEFGAYDKRPLPEQVANLQQALARMDKFQDLTGLRVDPVMTFPYEVTPPLETVRKLKEYGFSFATNADITPLGSAQPQDPLFVLRPMSSEFATFALVRRYPAEQRDPKSMIAIHAFLDDPLLFYAHHDLFTSGIGAFNEVADDVNQIEPDTHWSALGDVAQHLYLIKRHDNTHDDVLDYSSDFVLDNPSSNAVTFAVEKQEDGVTPIQGVTVNGQPSSYQLSDGYLRMEVVVPGGGSRRVVVSYQNDLDLAKVDISKKGLRFAILRHASDFRDITLSKYRLGRAITAFYYKHDMNAVEASLDRPVPLLILLLIVSSVVFLWMRKKSGVKKTKAKKPGVPREAHTN